MELLVGMEFEFTEQGKEIMEVGIKEQGQTEIYKFSNMEFAGKKYMIKYIDKENNMMICDCGNLAMNFNIKDIENIIKVTNLYYDENLNDESFVDQNGSIIKCNNKYVPVIFCPLKEDTIIPTRNSENSCIDIYANFEEDFILIKPNETKMISTGLASVIPEGYGYQLKERSSTGTKGMTQMAGVIDSGYRGEWLVPITNSSNKYLYIAKKEAEPIIKQIVPDAIIYPYNKAICQAQLETIPNEYITTCTKEELENFKSERGEGRLGSSGK